MSTRGGSLRKILTGFRLALDSPGTLIRGGLIGTLIGPIPGVGSSVSNLVSYSETKRASRNPESFGKGNPQGVAASESANSSSESGSMLSLCALVNPGGGGTTVRMAALTLSTNTSGPRFTAESEDSNYP